jgi:ATP-dependent helicase HrpB
VGYQIRFDDQTSLGTRICFVTEGILLRWLQDDPALSEIGAVLFDEFHERNLLSDVALALVKQLQETHRPDLKMVVMSATLDAKPVAEYLSKVGQASSLPKAYLAQPSPTEDSTRTPPLAEGAGRMPALPCPILISEGQSFAVEVNYLEHRDERPVSEQAADAVERIVNSGEPGDILVFMPGMGEINATINGLRAGKARERLALIPLHGELQPEEQDFAFTPNPLRKVVVATNVAETSVTIDGIRHVVDSGVARVARYDAERGISTLFIEEISRASAEQRKGRAGRTAPGTCHRLWTESGHLNRPERNTPEIQRSDLAEVVLLLHSLGIKRAVEFDWLDKPDPVAVERAEKLLEILGALRPAAEGSARSLEPVSTEEDAAPPESRRHRSIDSDLTPIGRRMLRLPMHPRYSRMLVEATKRGCVPMAALCAALVSGRDLLQRIRRGDDQIAEARELFEANEQSDFFTLMRAFQFAKKTNFNAEQNRYYGINAQVARQVEQTFEQILQLAAQPKLLRTERVSPAPENPQSAIRNPVSEDDALLKCIMTGFIDQLCRRRDQGTFECYLTEGRSGTLMRESVAQNAPLFVAAAIREVTGRGPENLTLLGMASVVKREWLEEMYPQHLSIQIEHLFDRTHKRVAALKLVRFRDLTIEHEHQREIDPVASGRALAEAFCKGWFELPLFNHEIKQLIGRVNLVTAVLAELEFPPLDNAAILKCLADAFHGLTLAKEAQVTPLREAFLAHLAQEQLEWLNELAPTSIAWIDGRRMKLLYAESARNDGREINAPELQVKLHECFGLKEHPRICEGKLPVKLWLGAPDGKRLEATLDWPMFRATAYPKLKSSLQRKYPGIVWV